MGFITDRKRAAGLGSSKSGTEHHWHMTITSMALVPLVIMFIFSFGAILGSPYAEVLAYYQRPFPAIIAILTLLVGFTHFANGAKSTVEDYTAGHTRQMLIIGVTCLSYSAAAFAIFAIVRIAL
jgi:succinate dehydrogenase / fumarate reductase membrane anchor subunit